jgi:hypothetical protein
VVSSESEDHHKIMKKVIIQSKQITPKQWSALILELNLMKRAWKSYAEIEISGPGVKKIIANGTKKFKD